MFNDDVIQICSNFRNDDLYIAPGIPNEKLYALAHSSMMPQNTQVWALLDTTVFGSAKNGMLITSNGLYIHNDGTGDNPGSYFVSWDDLWKTNNTMYPVKVGLGEVALTPSLQFEFSGCSMNADQLIPLLMNLRAAYGKYGPSQQEQASSPAAPSTQTPGRQVKCPFCDNSFDGNLKNCPSCGAPVSQQNPPESAPQAYAPPVQNAGFQQQPQANQFQGPAKSKTAYVLLAIFLGELGIHNFYAGYTSKAVTQLLISVLTCGYGCWISWIWAIIECSSVKTDANGVPFA